MERNLDLGLLAFDLQVTHLSLISQVWVGMILLLNQVANYFISRTDRSDCSDLVLLCSNPGMVLVKAEEKDFIITAFKDP
jgi:hypothetical protein